LEIASPQERLEFVHANNIIIRGGRYQRSLCKQHNIGDTGIAYVRGRCGATPFENVEVVPAARLDNILKNKKMYFAKIDSEGYEYLALRGVEELLGRCSLKIVREFCLEMTQQDPRVPG
jgi:FkbM family methyltransferase